MMPKIAEGDANKVWIVPVEIGKALEGLGSVDPRDRRHPDEPTAAHARVDIVPAHGVDRPSQDTRESRRPAPVGATAAAAGGPTRGRPRRGRAADEPARRLSRGAPGSDVCLGGAASSRRVAAGTINTVVGRD
jgi:hypothetical protein